MAAAAARAWQRRCCAAVAVRVAPGGGGRSTALPAIAAAGAAACAAAAVQERHRRNAASRCDVSIAGWSASHRGGARRTQDEVLKLGEKLVLSADCGGTTTRLMLYRVDPNEPVVSKKPAPGTLLAEEKYPNIAFKSFEDIIKLFLTQDCGVQGAKPSVAVLALAGVVMNNQCRFTNLDWCISGHELSSTLKIPKVELINDFVAQGYGMLTLGDDEVQKLNDATPQVGAPIACIGAGTGLGQCFLVPDSRGEYHCYPSEGAHGEFAPRGAGTDFTQIELLKHLKVKLNGWNRISVERVVSGTGICNVYEFLAYTTPEKIDVKVHKNHLAKPHDAGIIAQNAWPGSICERALKIFASCYGSQCGTMALSVQPFGGLYLTGGVTKRMAEWLLEEGSFLSSYYDKGRLSALLEKVPLMIVKSDDMGQRGAHLRAVQLLQTEIECQSRRLFEDLDVQQKGSVDVAAASKTLGEEGAKQLVAELDTNQDGVVDFFEFRQGFSKLPDSVLHAIRPVEELEVKMSKDELVAPATRGGDVARDASLNEMITNYNSKRGRRKYINPYEDRNAPVFKTVLYKLKLGGNRANPDDWLPRDYWVNKVGGVCWHSATENRSMLYLSKKDLGRAEIEDVETGPDSIYPYVFRVCPRQVEGKPAEPTEFAADSKEGKDFWMSQLLAMQAEGRALLAGQAGA